MRSYRRSIIGISGSVRSASSSFMRSSPSTIRSIVSLLSSASFAAYDSFYHITSFWVNYKYRTSAVVVVVAVASSAGSIHQAANALVGFHIGSKLTFQVYISFFHTSRPPILLIGAPKSSGNNGCISLIADRWRVRLLVMTIMLAISSLTYVTLSKVIKWFG